MRLLGCRFTGWILRWGILCMFVMLSVSQWKTTKNTLPIYSALLGVLSTIVLGIIKYLQVYKPIGSLSWVEYLHSAFFIPEKVVDLPRDVNRVFIILSLLELLLTIWLPVLLEVWEGLVWLKSLQQQPFLFNEYTLPVAKIVLEYFYRLYWLFTLPIEKNVSYQPPLIPERKQFTSSRTIIDLLHILFGLDLKKGMKRDYRWKPSSCFSQLIAPHLFIFSVQIAVEALVVVLGGKRVGRAILLHVTIVFNLVRGLPAFLSLWKAMYPLEEYLRCHWVYVLTAVFPCVLWIYSTFVFCWRKWLPIYYGKNHTSKASASVSPSVNQASNTTHGRVRKRK